jgi:chemotaxis protein histidine kinase CheA
MGQIDLSSYKSLYLQTAKEYIDKMLVSLDQLSSDVLDKKALNNLHIASHSLKGQSQVMGFVGITALSGVIEKKSRDILTEVAQADDKFRVFVKNSINKLSLELAKI